MAEARGHPAAPRRCAVLGSPIAHSLSPVLHRAAYEALGLDGWEYTGVECDEARLPGLLAGLDDSWVGLSLTMPLKRAVLPLLDEVSPLAASVRAVNTVLRHAPSAGLPVGGRSRLTGDNTDVPGMASLLADQAYAGEDGVMVLGGGATACAALAALAQRGASGVELRVREASRAQETVEVGTALG
ncbi:MAG: shikimate dehydrogenase family protein, partial [Acidimicrobiia bacterium]